MLKKYKLVFAAAVVLVASAVGVAAAQGHDQPDGDRAGMKEKWKEKKQAMLLKYDFNKNGSLDDTEMDAMHAERSAQRFERLDTNKDGVLSKAEFAAGKQARGPGKHHRGGHRGHRGGMKAK